MSVLASLLLFAGQDGSAAQSCAFDRVIPIAIAATDPVLAGHGPSKRVDYACEFSGTLHVWTRVESDLDTFVRVEDGDGKLIVEDDNFGGGKTPYVKLDVEPGRKLVVIAAASKADRTGDLELHLVAAPETPETRRGAEAGQQAVAEGRRLLSEKDLGPAREIVVKAIDALLSVPGGDESELVGQTFWDLAHLSSELNLLQSTAQRQELKYCERTLPPDHPDRLSMLSNVAVTIRIQGLLAEARQKFQMAYEGYSRTRPDDDPSLQIVRQNLANVLRDLGQYEDACNLERKVLEVYSKTGPADSLDLAWAQQCHALTLKDLGDLDGARELEEQVLAVFARTRADDDSYLVEARSNLADSLHRTGELDRARSLEEEALAVVSVAMPKDHRIIQTHRVNLASILADLGDEQRARLLLDAAIDAFGRTVPEDDPDLQRARIDLSTILGDLGDDGGERRLLESVLEALAHTLPETDPTVRAARANLATCLLVLGELHQAQEILDELLESLLRSEGEQGPGVQIVRCNLAAILQKSGELQAARSLQEQVLEVYSHIYPEDHPSIQDMRRYLMQTILGQTAVAASGYGAAANADAECDAERCADLCSALCRSEVRAARAAVMLGSSREAEERCAGLGKALDLALSFSAGFGLFPPDPALDREAFLLGETMRGAGLAAADVRRFGGDSEGSTGLREDLRNASKELSSSARRDATIDQIGSALAARERAERALTDDARRRSGSARSPAQPDPAALAERLGEHDALVGFQRYERGGWEFLGGGAGAGAEPMETGTPSICAFVLRRGPSAASECIPFVLTRVELGPLEPIEGAVTAWRRALGADGGRGVSGGASNRIADGAQGVEHGDEASGRELRRLVFDPLLPALRDARRVIVALDDVLHLVPLDALPLDHADDRGDLVGDRWQIETRSTLSEILAPSSPPAGENLLVALGGVDYDAGSEPLVAEARSPAEVARPSRIGSGFLRGGAWDGGFAPLPQTRLEVRGIASLFQGTLGANGSATVLEDQKASRDALAELAPRARWLHVATHGWNAPESVRSWADPNLAASQPRAAVPAMSADAMVRGMSPMSLCGLALAGANLPENAVSRVPGLVSAEDISALDLTNCELSVLSACDTGLGDRRRAGQGLASLQRALQMAGARSVITSLWKVPDEATKELMLDFYRRLWVERKPKGQALWEAKMKLRYAKSEAGRPEYSTKDWAAWVLTGDPN